MKLNHVKPCQKSLLLVYPNLIWAWQRGQRVKFCPKINFLNHFLSGGPLVPRGLLTSLPNQNMKYPAEYFKKYFLLLLNSPKNALNGITNAICCREDKNELDMRKYFRLFLTYINFNGFCLKIEIIKLKIIKNFVTQVTLSKSCNSLMALLKCLIYLLLHHSWNYL